MVEVISIQDSQFCIVLFYYSYCWPTKFQQYFPLVPLLSFLRSESLFVGVIHTFCLLSYKELSFRILLEILSENISGGVISLRLSTTYNWCHRTPWITISKTLPMKATSDIVYRAVLDGKKSTEFVFFITTHPARDSMKISIRTFRIVPPSISLSYHSPKYFPCL